MADFFVRKVCQTFDEATDSWFDTYEVSGLEVPTIMVDVPREYRDPNTIRRHLLRRGAHVPANSQVGPAISEAIAQDSPLGRRVAQVGWRDDGITFVTHHEVIAAADGAALVPPDAGAMSVHPSPAKGTLAAWLDVVKDAAYSTAMIVLLCAVFAAALIRPLRRQSFGLVIVGPSRSGKTTAELVAASALGFGTADAMPSLNATPAGLLAAACAFSDHMMPIDEVGSARGRKRDVYDTMRGAAYALMTGHDTIRHTSWEGAGGSRQTFRIIPTFTSEHSPEVWAARNGEFRDEGETARLIGLPVVPRGRRTVFDRAPKGLEGEALKRWEEELLKRLIEGVAANHGTAFPHFMRDFVSNVAARTAQAGQEQQFFTRKLRRWAHSPVALDIVGKFGLLFAGGVLAVRAGALPFTRNQVGYALESACRAALKALPNPHRDLAADLQALLSRLQSGGIIDQASATRRDLRMIRQADGFRRRKQGGTEYVLRSTTFSCWFANDARLRQLLNWLDENGFLQHSRSPKNGRSNEWAQQQVSWPDSTRQRSIVIYLPNGFGDLRM